MNISIIIFLLFQTVISFFLASTAKKNGRSFGVFFVLGLFISPVIGFIILIIIGDKNKKNLQNNIISGNLNICPYCYRVIEKKLLNCSFCGKDVSSEETTVKLLNPHIVNINKIKIREKPEGSSNILFDLSYNDIVSVIEIGEKIYDKNYWIHIKDRDGKKGWCFSENIKKIE